MKQNDEILKKWFLKIKISIYKLLNTMVFSFLKKYKKQTQKSRAWMYGHAHTQARSNIHSVHSAPTHI